jgi:chemotaxis signal transduction protein
MPAEARTERTCIIVVEIKIDSRRLNIGVIVDRVSEVLNIPGDKIDDPRVSERASIQASSLEWARSPTVSRYC